MRSLGAAYLKFCSFEQRDHKDRVIWFSGELSLNRQETCYLRHQKLRDSTTLRISFKNKCVNPISETVPAQTNNEDKEIETIDKDPPKAVRVRFNLRKQCAFGEQFLVVGNDPILGLWEPSNGLPLNWSENHVWIGEVDLPSGKAVDYKFVLKAKTGTIMWQTGPDRVLETWNTDRVITVFEDWDSPELQKVVEEDPSSSSNEDEETSFEKLELSPPVVESIEGLSKSDGYTNHVETMDAENIVDDSEAQDLSSGDETSSGNNDNEEENVRDDDDKVAMNGSDTLRSEGEPMLVSDDEDGPGLVPDLATITEDIGTVEENTVEMTDDKKIELKDKNDPASASECSIETDEVLIEEKQNHHNQKEQPEEDNTLEADTQWGRRTLQKFLAILGLQLVFIVEILET